MYRNCLTMHPLFSFSFRFVVLPSSTYLFRVSADFFLYFHLITLKQPPLSVGLLWTRDRPICFFLFMNLLTDNQGSINCFVTPFSIPFLATSNALFASRLAAIAQLEAPFEQAHLTRINVGYYPDLCL
jgi:hypothetical protein